ncbi:hypothetical protein QAD02_001888 [Eretmocerus hayati]|uniref:Uncharacterized protein n=1 Tax=Eretmocerus hayati TaxID=131215 RepID=A0ACC2NHB5_9HYME|nr:hypothetical protein QAD02_001888 [Eretmocerus hayati]
MDARLRCCKSIENHSFTMDRNEDIGLMIKKGVGYDVIQKYIELGADVKKRSNAGETPIETAVMKGDPELVQLLLDNGASVSIPPRRMTQCLAQAYMRIIPDRRITAGNKLDLVRILLFHGMVFSDLSGYPILPPLILETVTCDVLRELIIAGLFVPGFYEEEDELALTIALCNPDKDVWKYLVTNNIVDINDFDSEGRSILMLEARYNSPYLIELITAGANPNEYNGAMSPLSQAMYEVGVTKNFEFMFSISEPLNICLAFANATIMGYVNYKNYIIKQLALKSIDVLHPAVVMLKRNFGNHFDNEFDPCFMELQNELDDDFAGGVKWVDLVMSIDVHEFIGNRCVCKYVLDRMRPIPARYYWEEIFDKIFELRNLVLKREEAESKLSDLLGLDVNAYHNILRKITDNLQDTDWQNLIEV